MFIPFKSHLNSKQGSLIFLLFGLGSLARNSHPEAFCKEGVPRNFAKFTGKHLRQSLFFNKDAGLTPKACNFIKKRLWHRYFHVNIAKFLRTPFLIERLWWLPLFSIISSCLSKVKLVWVKSKFSDNCNLTFNVCIKTVNEFCVSNGAKWLSIHLWNKWFWNWLLLQLLKLQISRLFRARNPLIFRQLQSVHSL